MTALKRYGRRDFGCAAVKGVGAAVPEVAPRGEVHGRRNLSTDGRKLPRLARQAGNRSQQASGVGMGRASE